MGRSGTGHAVEGSTGGRDGPAATSRRWAAAGATRSSGEIGRRSGDRPGMHERSGMGDHHGRPPIGDKGGPGGGHPVGQCGVGLARWPVDGQLTGRQGRGQVRGDSGQLVERSSFGDAEVGLAPAVIDRGGREPGRFDDRRCRHGRPSRRAGHDPGAGRQVARQRLGEPQGLVDPDAGQRWVTSPAIPHTGPRRRRVPHQDDRDHVSGPVVLDRPFP